MISLVALFLIAIAAALIDKLGLRIGLRIIGGFLGFIIAFVAVNSFGMEVKWGSFLSVQDDIRSGKATEASIIHALGSPDEIGSPESVFSPNSSVDIIDYSGSFKGCDRVLSFTFDYAEDNWLPIFLDPQLEYFNVGIDRAGKPVAFVRFTH